MRGWESSVTPLYVYGGACHKPSKVTIISREADSSLVVHKNHLEQEVINYNP